MGNRNATHATTALPSSVACVVVDIMPPSSILCKKTYLCLAIVSLSVAAL